MGRDPAVYLWDAREAADAILSFLAGRTFEDYSRDLMLRSAVERQFEIIGESLNQLSKLDPGLAGRIPDLAHVVAFRNLLIHGYAAVDHGRVWRIVKESLPGLRAAIANLLDEWG